MNLIEKIVSYLCLRAEGFSHATAVQEFKRNPITAEDKFLFLWLIVTAIVLAVLFYDAHHTKQIQAVQEQNRIAEHKRKVAEHKAHKHEQIIIATLNGGTVRIDGVTRRVCVHDYNGQCL